ncbi:MAG TPA: carboxypeptidase-like regulatory domain-containing protein [Thermoanaerobaculia bacterium]|nr:carboxypeptidase-like regulatory domain-containing protein [Thermoanaerobaculia bacterium]
MRHLTITLTLLLVSPLLHAAVTGSIVDPNGNPVAGATVRAYTVEGRPDLMRRIVSGKVDREPLATVKTSDAGDFRFDKLGQPTVDLVAELPGRETVTRFTADGEDVTLMMRESKPRRVKLTANGKPVANAIVVYGRQLFTKSAEDGTFELPTLSKVPRLTIYHPDFAPFDTTVKQTDTEVKLDAGVKLTGKIVGSDGKTAANLDVFTGGWPLAKSGDDGSFTIAHAPSHWSELRAETKTDVAIATRATGSSYTLHLRRGATVTGVVRDAKTRMPVAGMMVAFFGSGAVTDASGAFTFSPVLPGRYPFNGSHPLYEVAGNGPIPTIVVPATGSRESIAATRLPLISGTVVDEERKPVAGAVIGRFAGFSQMPSVSTVSRRNGVFSFHGGTTSFNRQFEVSKDGYADTAFSVNPGEGKTGFTVTLPRGVALAMHVIDGSRNPVSGATVHVSPSRQGFGPTEREVRCSGGDCLTANDGSLTLRVAPAKYDIMVAGAGIVMKRVAAQDVDARSAPLTITVDRGVDVSGRVTYSDGKPVTSPVGVTMEANGIAVSESSDDSGTFTLHGVPRGKVSLRAEIFQAARLRGTPKEITAPATDVVLTIPRGGTITGHVVDSSSGSPIADFDISTSRSGGMPVSFSANVVHADDGSFTIRDVMPGRVEVVASADGYVRGSATGIDVAEGQSVDNVEVRLDRAARLKGKVTSTDGTPLSGVMVSVNEQGMRRPGRAGDQGTTDGDGLYELTSVPPGDRNITFSKQGFVAATKSVTTAAGKESQLDAALDQGRELTGRVINDSGQPVNVAEVRIEGQPIRPTQTDSDGSFTIAGIRDGKFSVIAHREGYVDAREEVDPAAQSNVTLTLTRGATIVGRVTGLSAEELGNTFVSFYGGTGGYGNTRPDAAGNFTLTGVRDGRINVQAAVGTSGGGRSARKVVEVINGTAPEVDLAFTTGFTVHGRVNGHGRVMSDFRVMFSPADASNPPGASGPLDTDGSYSVSGLGSGEYRVSIFGPAVGLVHSEKYSVSGDSALDIDLHASAIRGRVTDRDGKPLPDVRIIASAIKGSDTTPSLTPPLRPALTDSDGRYLIDFVPDGSFHLIAQKEQYQSASHDVTVAGGAPDTDFQLDSGTASTVRVVDAAGAPLFANVSVVDQNGHGLATVQTNTDTGVAQLWVPPGHYQLYAGAQGYARAQSAIDVPGPEVRVTLTHGGTIIAVVKDPTKVQVVLAPAGMAPGGQVSVRSNNHWDHVTPGTYDVREYIIGNKTPVQTKQVTVFDDQTVTVTFD